MIGQPITHAELEQVYGVSPAITGRIRHMLQRDSYADHPDIVRGILSLHSKQGLGLDLGRAYTTYFFLLGVSPGSARLLTHPHFVEPTITYGKALVRAGVTQDVVPYIVPTFVPAEDPAEPNPEGAPMPFVITSAEEAGELMALPDMDFPGGVPAPMTAHEQMTRATVSGGVMPEWITDHVASSGAPGQVGEGVLAGPLLVASGQTVPDLVAPQMDVTSGLEVGTHGASQTWDRSGQDESMTGFGAAEHADAGELEGSGHNLSEPLGMPVEQVIVPPSEDAAGAVADEVEVGVTGVLREVHYPVSLQGDTSDLPAISQLHEGGEAAGEVEWEATPPVSDHGGVLPRQAHPEQTALPTVEGELVDSGEAFEGVDQPGSVALEGGESSDDLAVTGMWVEDVAEADLGSGMVPESAAVEGVGSGQPGVITAEGVGEGLREMGSESGEVRTLMFPSEEASVVGSAAQQAPEWRTDAGLAGMAEQVRGTFQKASFPVVGGGALGASEDMRGSPEVEGEVELAAGAEGSRVPIWAAEDRLAHPLEIGEYARMFPDLEGLTMAVEAMQPYFQYVQQMDAYYLEYPSEKGKRSLEDVQGIGEATRSLLDSLEHLSAPDANLFAPEFEAADVALTRLLGAY